MLASFISIHWNIWCNIISEPWEDGFSRAIVKELETGWKANIYGQIRRIMHSFVAFFRS